MCTYPIRTHVSVQKTDGGVDGMEEGGGCSFLFHVKRKKRLCGRCRWQFRNQTYDEYGKGKQKEQHRIQNISEPKKQNLAEAAGADFNSSALLFVHSQNRTGKLEHLYDT